MKRILLLPCLLLLIASGVVAQPENKPLAWKRYTVKHEEFSVMSGLPFGLQDKAVEAAKKIRFIPATKDGKFVSAWMQLEYHFSLN